MNSSHYSLKDRRVAVATLSGGAYPEDPVEILGAIKQNSEQLGWDDGERGAFGKVVFEGAKVLIKPNFVMHANQGDGGLLPLITHPSLIKAVVSEVLKANPKSVVVGDAPIQSCDFDMLLESTGLGAWSHRLQEAEPRFFGIRDLRRTTCVIKRGVLIQQKNIKPIDEYVLFNLGTDSLLEELTTNEGRFRVTNYDPRLLAERHSIGNHQYLISRDVLESNVVINLPKLKTHKKAGITNALKNLVGINGNKEFLPHHRLGGTSNGGDCYSGSDSVKQILESVLDRQNMADSPTTAKVYSKIATQLERVMRFKGDEIGIEGSWSGNETVPRMTLDLNRILLYGRTDAAMSDTIQRRVVHVVDAVVAGQGNGPLAPLGLSLGLILAGENAVAVDWVGAHLLGYDPRKIPLVRDAFSDFRWPIAEFEPADVVMLGDSSPPVAGSELLDLARSQTVIHPKGWQTAKA